LRAALPKGPARRWVMSPTSLVGAAAVLGPALAAFLRREGAGGLIPHVPVLETHPRASLLRLAPDLQDAARVYKSPRVPAEERAAAIGAINGWLEQHEVVAFEADRPATDDQLDAVIAAVVALGASGLDPRLQVTGFDPDPGDVLPAGPTRLVVLNALI
jgi:hypothetical protein